MDEILIEEKKYISSKQAAKITGYAKDYIGQLCREGRVPARLVGRSWYVLETAIQDHRFGDSDAELKKEAINVEHSEPIRSTWESPRYEALSEEVLPSVNRLREAESTEGTTLLEESWREWFDRFDAATMPSDMPEEATDIAATEAIEAIEAIEPEEVVEEAEVAVAINTEPQEHYQPREPLTTRKKQGKGASVMIQFIGVLGAVAIAAVAVMGSGYLDEYMTSNSRASMVAGVSFYNK